MLIFCISVKWVYYIRRDIYKNVKKKIRTNYKPNVRPGHTPHQWTNQLQKQPILRHESCQRVANRNTISNDFFMLAGMCKEEAGSNVWVISLFYTNKSKKKWYWRAYKEF